MWEYSKERAKEFVSDWLDTPIIWYDKELSERNPEEAPVSGTEEYWQEVLSEIYALMQVILKYFIFGITSRKD